MNRNGRVALCVVIIGVLLLATAPGVGAAPNVFDFLCRRVKNDVVKAVCELHYRVVALEENPALTVKQANGETVGLLLDVSEDVNGPYHVWDTGLKKIMLIELPDGGVTFPAVRSAFIYESADCSGTPMKDTPLSPYYIYRLEGENPYGWTHVEISDLSNVRQNVAVRSQWEGNPVICMPRNDTMGVVSELSPVTPPSYVGPLTIVEE